LPFKEIEGLLDERNLLNSSMEHEEAHEPLLSEG